MTHEAAAIFAKYTHPSFMTQADEDTLCTMGVHAWVDKFDGYGQECTNCSKQYRTF